jgi:hypothetical protein
MNQYRPLNSVRPEVSKAIAGLRYLSLNGNVLQSEQCCNTKPNRLPQTLLLTAMFAVSWFGASVAQAGSHISPTKITALLPRPYAGMSLYVSLDKASTEPGCTNAAGVLRVDPALGITEAGFKLISQSIHLAFLMNKTVTIYVDGCLDGHYSKIFAVDVTQ